mmetsp:Transcript_52356/g.132990  ORF Transcript_52356/g.132990 Transcript_52356/m.132990 type:complete len:244 (-) Transcript_52356:275-1006(-)
MLPRHSACRVVTSSGVQRQTSATPCRGSSGGIAPSPAGSLGAGMAEAAAGLRRATHRRRPAPGLDAASLLRSEVSRLCAISAHPVKAAAPRLQELTLRRPIQGTAGPCHRPWVADTPDTRASRLVVFDQAQAAPPLQAHRRGPPLEAQRRRQAVAPSAEDPAPLAWAPSDPGGRCEPRRTCSARPTARSGEAGRPLRRPHGQAATADRHRRSVGSSVRGRTRDLRRRTPPGLGVAPPRHLPRP